VNMHLLILGVNILVVSVLLIVYGILISDSGLVGIALSTSIVGGVLVVYSTIPQDPSITALTGYSEILINAVTSTLEDLDLLESQICAIKRGDNVLLVYSKTPCPLEVDPGVGFTSGSPYLAIPLRTLSELVESSSETTSTLLERALTTLLIEEYSACRSVRVEEESGFYRVHISGLVDVLKQYLERPLDPYTLLALVAASSALTTRCVRLIDKRIMPDSVLLLLGVERGAEET